mgnify:CR=1 FL=1
MLQPDGEPGPAWLDKLDGPGHVDRGELGQRWDHVQRACILVDDRAPGLDVDRVDRDPRYFDDGRRSLRGWSSQRRRGVR